MSHNNISTHTNFTRKLILAVRVPIVALLLVYGVIYAISYERLTSKVDAINTKVNKIDRDISCAEVFNNGSTGKQSCIGIVDQLDDTKKLDDIQQRLDDIQQRLN
jgi:hypothetical protein